MGLGLDLPDTLVLRNNLAEARRAGRADYARADPDRT